MPFPDDLPQRCESRLSQRPPLRRTHASYRLPKLFGFDDSFEDDFDDDSDPEFSPAAFAARAMPPGLSERDGYDDDDEDDLGELIRFRLDDGDAYDLSASPSFPPLSLTPLLLPRPASPAPAPALTTEDFFNLDTPPAYHGFSYHALALIKRVWNGRRAHWAAGRSPDPDASAAYDGIAVAPHAPDYPIPDDYAAPAAATPPPEPRVAPADPDVPIFPRLGDLCSLRDARAAAVDRAFCNFPTYTIRKVLYLHDMMRPGARGCAWAAGAGTDERAVSVLCEQFERAMVLEGPLPVCAKGWTPASFARWRILLEKATGRHVPADEDDTSYHSSSFSSYDEKVLAPPPRPKTPHFFLLDEDDDEDGDGDDSFVVRRSESASGESDEEGWDDVSLEGSPGRRRGAAAVPVFYLDRRTLPAPAPAAMHIGHVGGIMAH